MNTTFRPDSENSWYRACNATNNCSKSDTRSQRDEKRRGIAGGADRGRDKIKCLQFTEIKTHEPKPFIYHKLHPVYRNSNTIFISHQLTFLNFKDSLSRNKPGPLTIYFLTNTLMVLRQSASYIVFETRKQSRHQLQAYYSIDIFGLWRSTNLSPQRAGPKSYRQVDPSMSKSSRG